MPKISEQAVEKIKDILREEHGGEDLILFSGDVSDVENPDLAVIEHSHRGAVFHAISYLMENYPEELTVATMYQLESEVHKAEAMQEKTNEKYNQ